MDPSCMFEKLATAVAEQQGTSSLEHILGNAYFTASGDIVFLDQDEHGKQDVKPSTMQPQGCRYTLAAYSTVTKPAAAVDPPSMTSTQQEPVMSELSVRLLSNPSSDAVLQAGNENSAPPPPPHIPNIQIKPIISEELCPQLLAHQRKNFVSHDDASIKPPKLAVPAVETKKQNRSPAPKRVVLTEEERR